MVNIPLQQHLEFIAAADDGVNASQFAAALDLQHFGRQMLHGYITGGLVRRDWKNSRGKYSLTPAGQDQLRRLQAARNNDHERNAHSRQ